MAQPSTFVNQVRANVTTFMQAYETLLADKKEYDSLGGSAFVDDYLITPSPTDITLVDFTTAVSSIEALRVLLEDQFHATNLNRLRL